MEILGNFLKSGVKLSSKIQQFSLRNLQDKQEKNLVKLLSKARSTAFGKHYQFNEILNQMIIRKGENKFELFRKIPFFDYDTLYDSWWHRCHSGESDVCWPGKIKYFALSSGTSGASSKRIPVSKDMIKAINKAGVKQIIALGNFPDLPSQLFDKSYLLLGGSTNLKSHNENFEGDLSGITTGNIPFWFERFFKPGKQIASVTDWEIKLNEIVEKAPHWDIGFIAGVPAWVQILLEKIVQRYALNNIHDIWPNLKVYGWGGVSIEPYRQSFERLFSQPVTLIETYLASEGFIGIQNKPDTNLRLLTNNGIFFEFIPFDNNNFDEEGQILPHAQAITIADICNNVDYALAISTCSGAWRYLIGDTIQFTNSKNAEFKITGRTKSFLSLVGEHISVSNLNQAISRANQHFGIEIKEYTVIGKCLNGNFGHHWYIDGAENINVHLLSTFLDQQLKILNDDYAIERKHALKDFTVTLLPEGTFLEWMKQRRKVGGQHKVPRVMKGQNKEMWERFIAEFLSENATQDSAAN